jgi:plastocyanin
MKHVLTLSLLFSGMALNAQRLHTISAVNDLFEPDVLVMEAGDEVLVRLTGDHTFTEVSENTFRLGGQAGSGGIDIGHTSRGGIEIGQNTAYDGNEALVTFSEPGTYHFVSRKASDAMKAVVIVLPSENTAVMPVPHVRPPLLFPNPATDHVRLAPYADQDFQSVEVFDGAAMLVMRTTVRRNEPLNVLELVPGRYTVRITDGLGNMLGSEQLVIER